MTLPWWAIDTSSGAVTDIIGSIWVWGLGFSLFVALLVLAWMEAGHRVRGIRSETSDIVIGLFVTVCVCVLWPVALVGGIVVGSWYGLLYLMEIPHRRILARELAARENTPEALTARARKVQSDIEARLAELGSNPEHAVEAARLRMAVADLRSAS